MTCWLSNRRKGEGWLLLLPRNGEIFQQHPETETPDCLFRDLFPNDLAWLLCWQFLRAGRAPLRRNKILTSVVVGPAWLLPSHSFFYLERLPPQQPDPYHARRDLLSSGPAPPSPSRTQPGATIAIPNAARRHYCHPERSPAPLLPSRTQPGATIAIPTAARRHYCHPERSPAPQLPSRTQPGATVAIPNAARRHSCHHRLAERSAARCAEERRAAACQLAQSCSAARCACSSELLTARRIAAPRCAEQPLR